MYKIIKDAGRLSNVFLQNSDTKATLNLGAITPKIIELLKISDYGFDDRETLHAEWDYTIKEDTVDEFKRIAMPMRKPIRKTKVNNEKETPEEIEEIKDTKEKDNEEDELDLFDLIYND